MRCALLVHRIATSSRGLQLPLDGDRVHDRVHGTKTFSDYYGLALGQGFIFEPVKVRAARCCRLAAQAQMAHSPASHSPHRPARCVACPLQIYEGRRRCRPTMLARDLTTAGWLKSTKRRSSLWKLVRGCWEASGAQTGPGRCGARSGHAGRAQRAHQRTRSRDRVFPMHFASSPRLCIWLL